ncbi:MAG: hypothetical protein NW202_13030 [Nitrospira sp.]|nr:hypothetical protein [Nitrospira sp.]
MSPTARSLQHLRDLGYHARVVERWNPFAKVRQDLFGGDILALKPGSPVLIVQATTGSNHAARREKLEAEGFTALWTGAGARLEIWSWAKQGGRGKRKRWQVRREAL